MGGSALKVPISRMNQDEYAELSAKCLAAVQACCQGVRCAVIPSYSSKGSFGDLDVLVSKEHFNANDVAKVLGAVEVFHQKNAIYRSMGIRLQENGAVYQVDFIEEPSESYDFALCYYGFNDLGNLLGILMARLGLKLKHNGLYYYPRRGDEVLGEIRVSGDFKEVLRFAGLDPERFAAGFDNLTAMFDFIRRSRFFSPEAYLLENRNHRSRTRDRKRPTYRAFLQYCASFETQPKESHSARAGIEEAFLFFDGFKAQIDQIESAKKDLEKQKQLFNGEVVRDITGLSGRALGDFLLNLKINQQTNGLLQAIQANDMAALHLVVTREFEQLADRTKFDV